MLKKLKNLLVEAVFPSHCVWCEQLGSLVCSECEKKILRVKSQTCHFCNRISKNGKTCKACRRKHDLDGVLVFGYFKDKRLKEIIHQYKYEDLFALKGFLGQNLATLLVGEVVGFEVITYVPLGKKRLSKRGYNQAELLAKEVGNLLLCDAQSLLKRKKETRPQVGLKMKERIGNLKGAFKAASHIKIYGKKIVIVDDVMTTGSTLNECAKTLKEAGAKKVWGLVVSKE